MALTAGARRVRVGPRWPQDATGTDKSQPAALVMMATGRRPRSSGLGLEAVGVNVGRDGTVLVRRRSRTERAVQRGGAGWRWASTWAATAPCW